MADDISPLPTTGRSAILATRRQTRFHHDETAGSKEVCSSYKKALIVVCFADDENAVQVDVDGLTITVAADVQPTHRKDRKSKTTTEGKEILVDAHLRLKYGQRYGLLGRNGTGKSSKFL